MASETVLDLVATTHVQAATEVLRAWAVRAAAVAALVVAVVAAALVVAVEVAVVVVVVAVEGRCFGLGSSRLSFLN